MTTKNANTPTPPAETVVVSPEDKNQFLRSFGFGRRGTTPAPATDKKKDGEIQPAETEEEKKKREEQEAAARAEKEKADAEKEKGKKKPAPRRPPTIPGSTPPAATEPADTETVINKTAEKVGKAVAEALKKEGTAPGPAATKITLTAKEQRKVEKLRGLEGSKQFGESYKGKADELVAWWEKEQAYVEAWKAKHPDEEYDPEHEDHEAFYEKQPDIIDDDKILEDWNEEQINKRVAERTTEAENKIRKEFEPKFNEQNIRKQFEETEPAVQEAGQKAVIAFLEDACDDEMKKILVVDGKFNLSDANVKKFQEQFPEYYDILYGATAVVDIVTRELESFSRRPWYPVNTKQVMKGADDQPFVYDGRTIYPHKEILEFSIGEEDRIMALPEEQQMWTDEDGKTRRFVTTEEYGEMEKQVMDSKLSDAKKKEQLQAIADAYWVLTPQWLKGLYKTKMLREVKSKIGKINTLAETRLKRINPNAAGTPPKPGTSTPPALAAEKKNSPPPAVVSGGDKVTTSAAQTKASASNQEQVSKVFFGRG